jgi:hypothetical protein
LVANYKGTVYMNVLGKRVLRRIFGLKRRKYQEDG